MFIPWRVTLLLVLPFQQFIFNLGLVFIMQCISCWRRLFLGVNRGLHVDVLCFFVNSFEWDMRWTGKSLRTALKHTYALSLLCTNRILCNIFFVLWRDIVCFFYLSSNPFDVGGQRIGPAHSQLRFQVQSKRGCDHNILFNDPLPIVKGHLPRDPNVISSKNKVESVKEVVPLFPVT